MLHWFIKILKEFANHELSEKKVINESKEDDFKEKKEVILEEMRRESYNKTCHAINVFFESQTEEIRSGSPIRYSIYDISSHLRLSGINDRWASPSLSISHAISLYLSPTSPEVSEAIMPHLKKYYHSCYHVVIFKRNNINQNLTDNERLFLKNAHRELLIVIKQESENFEKIKKKEFEERSLIEEEIFIKKARKYQDILLRKRRNLIIFDDYGFEDTKKWEEEKHSFLRKLDLESFWDFHSIQDASLMIDVILNTCITPIDDFNDNMSPREYESFCSQILSDAGWESRVTKGSGDQGVDVIAKKGKITVAIQCKLFNQPVGNSAVQEVYSGAKFYGADKAIVVTNNTYTPHARTLANSTNVMLIHHNDLKNIELL
ncbi:restriction endonuclease [Tatumella terrea]|uniref:Restriction endonuclease n=1 Tax=Tatumella terrea TaxID=419007 RepID=A0ABW1VX30_9GAMM